MKRTYQPKKRRHKRTHGFSRECPARGEEELLLGEERKAEKD